MIKRISDNQILPQQLEKIAEAVAKKESIQLFDIVDKDKVELVKKQLRIQGYDVKTESVGDKVKVYAIMPEKVKFIDAIESGAFKKLAWGRYSFQRESTLGMFKYDFDDGSIWKVIKDAQNGEEYLIKEVTDDENEDIVRNKTASNNKQQFVNDDNVKYIISMLYNDIDTSLLHDIQGEADIKSRFYSMLNTKFERQVEAIALNNHFIQSPDYIADLKGVIKTALDNKRLNSNKNLDKLINEYNEQIIAKTGKMNKLF
jgi:hypothetical protein